MVTGMISSCTIALVHAISASSIGILRLGTSKPPDWWTSYFTFLLIICVYFGSGMQHPGALAKNSIPSSSMVMT